MSVPSGKEISVHWGYIKLLARGLEVYCLSLEKSTTGGLHGL